MTATLASRPRFLIAEDNYLMAQEVGDFVRRCGYDVAGAVPTVETGLALLAEAPIQGAIIDIDLAGEPSYPICEVLASRGLPFVFLSAYSSPHALIPEEFRHTPQLGKPIEPMQFELALRQMAGSPPPSVALEPLGNAVLDGLDESSRGLVVPSLERVELRAGERLQSPGKPTGDVYFPVEGLISLFAGNTRGTRIEIATVGRDGMTAPGLLLGDITAGSEAVVQAPGAAWRLPAMRLRRLAEFHAPLRRHLLDHAGEAMRQIMETASYSGRATIVERLARWLVQASQRLGGRQLTFTHDALAEILGVRRPSVTTSLQLLEGQRLIRSTRRTIVILDLEGLIRLSSR